MRKTILETICVSICGVFLALIVLSYTETPLIHFRYKVMRMTGLSKPAQITKTDDGRFYIDKLDPGEGITIPLVISEPQLPPGYKVMCSLDGKKYTVWIPSNHDLSVNVFDTKEDAIDFANYWEKTRNEKVIRESAKYQWKECQ